ncbi:developmental checkpoint coupling sporulation initiation to replication initiation [Salirhabdus euzebyi]|uniref:Developmental checkpoint coupling sporulation initiation to replication initiation n=1 Tax=Salirhabdus euzebyi TaxID=394506 RepID=A0A841Q7S1_9BACI|nr:sporulation histidine kinase inhibitor Sda [Salirhabdus euzebyi]MBB6454629.1 developmental checkpoint coupling sporulation initiation to replication initiation [Salirhabdus euzebyi]
MFIQLSDNALINAYQKALQLNLEKDFIILLEKELKNRGVNLKEINKKVE